MKEKIGIVGYGHLGSALDRGLTLGGYETTVNNGDIERTRQKLELAGVDPSKARELWHMAEDCTVLALCVKSRELADVGYELSKHLRNRQIVFSFLAQTSLSEVISTLGDKAFVAKAMTTLGVAEQKGVSAFQLSESEDQRQVEVVTRLISDISASECVFKLNSEEEMQLFTVAVGCFPGILAHFLNQLKLCIRRRNNGSLADYENVLPTLLGSVSKMLIESGSTQTLQNKVATKGGVTQAMIDMLEQSGLSDAIDRSIEAGLERMELSNK